MSNNKKRILVMSPNFCGGGLEIRINTIIERFYKNFSYSLLTKTPINEMRIAPSNFFNKIYNWDNLDDAINNADIISMHPFFVFNELKNLHLLDNKTLLYTLHGEASFRDNIAQFGDKIDVFYAVSKKLIEIFKLLYPQYADKIYFFKNYYSIQNKKSSMNFDANKKILFCITNLENQEYLNMIIKQIPYDYHIHIIGSEQFNEFEHPNIIYDGFVDIDSYLSANKFSVAFARGGYLAMDLIANGIPLILIYERNRNFYAEVLNKTNFEKLSNQNFVTFQKATYENISNIFKQIEQNYDNYYLSDLLKLYNDSSLMFNPYTRFKGDTNAISQN